MIRLLDLDRRQEVERRIGADDGAPGDERPFGARRDVDRVTLPRLQPKRVERRRVEAKAIAGGVPPFGRGERRVVLDGLRDMTSDLVPAQQHRCCERCDEHDGCDERQPNRRTPRRTRIALKPSFHVIFFPSA